MNVDFVFPNTPYYAVITADTVTIYRRRNMNEPPHAMNEFNNDGNYASVFTVPNNMTFPQQYPIIVPAVEFNNHYEANVYDNTFDNTNIRFYPFENLTNLIRIGPVNNHQFVQINMLHTLVQNDNVENINNLTD